ncbi:MAG: hypothetical protein KF862_10595 [Chitinophagaceae bacterium]|nr:hypothetical protein [Chitinophagaceae bacterium]
MKYLLLLICLYGVYKTSLFAQQSNAVPGTVISYSPAASGLYIGSPSICILPGGDLLASHDLFGPSSNEFVQPVSRIFRSSNNGRSWKQVAEIKGQFWSKLFVHRGRLYFMGTDKHHGNTIIRTSANKGDTWTEPADAEHGLLLAGEYHCAPMPVVEYKGKLWRAMEDAMGPVKQWGKRYGSIMMSIDADADLMQAKNWKTTNVLRYDSTLLSGNFGGWIEGNAVIAPDGNIVNILRVDDRSTMQEKAAVIKISGDGVTASFDSATGFYPFPGGSKKFTIRYDSASHLYWTLSNYIPDTIRQKYTGKNPASVRNTQALFSSPDLINWQLRKVLLHHPDIVNHGFQYVDWLFHKKDILFVCRTAYDDGAGGAHNNHDANFLTFHRIKNFRKLLR